MQSSISSSSSSSSMGNHNNNKRQIASLGNNTPKRIRISDNAIDKQSLEQVKIDGYRQSLKENGFAEIDIPKELQEQIDVVNKVLRGNQRNHKIDDSERSYHDYFDPLGKHLSSDKKDYIRDLLSNFKSFITEKLDKIVSVDKEKTIKVSEEVKLNIRLTNDLENLFHKDARIQYPFSIRQNITVIFPMLGQKGTTYIPYNKKKNYPENEELAIIYIDGNCSYKKNVIEEQHIQYADPNKIFLFLCRRASRDLGEDYDDKSLIHAVPKSEKTDEPRIFMLGRFCVKDKDITSTPPL